ncbi:MAG TPA: serine protease [Anaerolineae bacterium]|nr:serine protease [Anaerolineae bacterium]
MNRTMNKRVGFFILAAVLLAVVGLGTQTAPPVSATPHTTRQMDDEYLPEEFGETGKTPATPGEQPWMVALVEDGWSAKEGQMCGGALIAPQWVLTAAHCIEDMRPDEVDVVIGRYQLSSQKGERLDADALIPHPQYGDFNDIGLIHLAQPATAGQPVSLITAVNEHLDDPPTIARATGWGLIPEKGEEFSPDKLHEVNVPIVSLEQCRAAYGRDVDSSVICAGLEEGGADVCYGDSGGPLVVPDGRNWALAGIVSWGDGCGLPNAYGVYTRVASYEDWIAGYLDGSTPIPVADAAPGDAPMADDSYFADDNEYNEFDENEYDDSYQGEEWDDYGTLLDSWETAAGITDVYDLGAYDGDLAELALTDDAEIVTVKGADVLLEDWSDEYGPFFTGLLIVDGRLLEISSDIGPDAVLNAVDTIAGQG